MLSRFGVSFISQAQACANAEEEVPDWNWNAVQGASQAKWEDVLQRVKVDVSKEDPTVVQLLYSSVSEFDTLKMDHLLNLLDSYTEHLLYPQI